MLIIRNILHQDTSEAMTLTIKHAHLGDMKGNTVDGAAEFLGLKYAKLKNRLAPAELIDSYGAGSIDATRYGYIVESRVCYPV